MANSDPFLDLRRDAVVAVLPSCPKCHSTDLYSAAKHPTGDSYWRCAACGRVWKPRQLGATPPQGPRQ